MKQRILIVEDDLTIQTQLKNLLSGNGYEVGVVSDFSKVIEQVKTFAPHLVLLDIKLPGNSGFDICSQIRTFSEIPIIFVTSSNTDMDELNSIMLGGMLSSQSHIIRQFFLPKSPLFCERQMLLRKHPRYLSGMVPLCIWRAASLNTVGKRLN